MKEDQIPTAKIVMHEVQVGSPKYPDGIIVAGKFEVVGVHWELKEYWWRKNKWVHSPKTYEKKFVVPIMRKEVEALLQEWSEKWTVFENFREVIVNKALARKAFDDQFVAYHEAFNEIFPKETYEARLKAWEKRAK